MKPAIVPASASDFGTLHLRDRIEYPSASDPVSNTNGGPDQVPITILTEGVPKPSDTVGTSEPRFISVKALVARYDISKSTVYEHIKTDPSFPVENVGVKKKFMIDPIKFEKWLTDRTNRERHQALKIPTADQLLERFKK